MPKTMPTALKIGLAFLPLITIISGCGSSEVPLQKVDKPVVIAPPKAEDVPKSQRGGAGTSAGMNYDPSGMGGPPR